MPKAEADENDVVTWSLDDIDIMHNPLDDDGDDETGAIHRLRCS